MGHFRNRIGARWFLPCTLLLALLFQPGRNRVFGPGEAREAAPYIARGVRVEARFQAYRRVLARYFDALSETLEASAPDLLRLLDRPEGLRTGYQILPNILAESATDEPPSPGITAYSWPWTDRLITSELRKIINLEMELRHAAALKSALSRSSLEKLARGYRQLSDRQRNIDAHIQYNRFWQADIAADRKKYMSETRLQRLVLERQNIAAELMQMARAFERFNARWNSASQRQLWPGMAAILKKREAGLSRRIDEVLNHVDIPAFVVVDRDAEGWIIRVPFWTDIDDDHFVGAVKNIIETSWRASEPGQAYRVELNVRYISPEELYRGSIEPARGAAIDPLRHLSHFPAGAAVLTSGAITTHVLSRAIVLGPQPIASGTLAHEFGHILGFRDAYIRGYRDLGADGFQVMEVTVDPRDIMAAPATGRVQAEHFHRLIGRSREQKPLLVPAATDQDYKTPITKPAAF
jgi:hypothetical protein